MRRPTVVDARGVALNLGDRVRGGGRVVAFHEPDESHWRVAVEWDDLPGDPEVFSTGGPTVYMDEFSTHVCADVERDLDWAG